MTEIPDWAQDASEIPEWAKAPTAGELLSAGAENAYAPFKPIISDTLEALKNTATETGKDVSEPYNESNVPNWMVPADVTMKTLGKVGNAIGGAYGAAFSPVQGALTASAETAIPLEAKGLASITGQNPDLTPDQIHSLAQEQGGDLTNAVMLGMATPELKKALTGEVLPPESPPTQSVPLALQQTIDSAPATTFDPSSYTPDYHFDTDSFGVKDKDGNFVKTGFDNSDDAANHVENLNSNSAAESRIPDWATEPIPDDTQPISSDNSHQGSAPELPASQTAPDNRNYDEVMVSGNYDEPKIDPNQAAKAVDVAAMQVNTQPTEAQKEAGNYAKGHVRVQGLDIAIENPRGSERSGIDSDGSPWSVKMPNHYGYIKGTEGADGEHVDTYIGPNPASDKAFVVDQVDANTGDFDEHKVMLGYDNQQQAISQYEKAFSDGKGIQRVGAVTPMSVDDLKTWLKNGDTQKPLANLSQPTSNVILHDNREFAQHAINYPQDINGMHQAARDFVNSKSADDGNEHSVMLDTNTGRALNVDTSGSPTQVTLSDKSNADALNPDLNIAFHHSHGNTLAPLSPEDIENLSYYPGIKQVYAHTPRKISVASLPDLSKYPKGSKDLGKLLDASRHTIEKPLLDMINKGALDEHEASYIWHEAGNRALDNTGVIKYDSQNPIAIKYADLVNQMTDMATDAIQQKLNEIGEKNGNIEPNAATAVQPSNEVGKGEVGEIPQGATRNETLEGNAGNKNEKYPARKKSVGKPKVKPLSPDELQRYYTPERLVQGYGGTDRVIAFHPDTGNGWSVDVRHVRPDGAEIPSEGTRNHSTLPSIKKVRDVLARDGAFKLPEGLPVVSAIKNLWKDESGSVAIDAPREIRDLISPTMAGEGAKATAQAIRKAYGLAERERAKDETVLNKVARQSSRLTDEQKLDFYNYVEGRSKGAILQDKSLQQLADSVRQVYERMRNRLEALPETRKMNFIQDYFTHQWKNEEAAQKFINDFIAQQGSKRNLKQRVLPTIADGLAAGLELEEPNPVRAVSKYLGSMNNFIASVDGLRTIVNDLGGTYYAKGKQPEGYMPLVGRNAERIEDAKIDPVSGSLIPSRHLQLYAPADVARIYNRFYSSGFENTGLKSTYELAKNAINANTLFELGLSTYHAGTINIQSINQDMQRIFKNAIVGDWNGVADAARKLATPGAHYKQGKKLVEQYKGLKDHGIDLEQIADHFAKANLRLGLDPLSKMTHGGFWEAHERGELPDIIDDLKRKVSEGYGFGLLKAGSEVTGRVMSDVSAPLFKYYIPPIKMSSFGDLMSDWLRQHPSASDTEIAIARVRISDMIDDRFGEMNMNNIFWNKLAKQITGLIFRAPGWDLGLIRQIGGAGKDIYSMLNDAVTRKRFNPDLLDRPLYMVAAVTLYAAMNSAMTWAKTGVPPTDQEIKDFIAYRTGGMRRQFSKMIPERGVLPGHGKEIVNLYPLPGKGPLSGAQEEIKNKVASLPKNIGQVIENEDWKDKPIYDPKSKDWTKSTPVVAQASHLLGGFEPFALQGITTSEPNSNLSIMEKALGVKAAGTRITDRTDLQKVLERK